MRRAIRLFLFAAAGVGLMIALASHDAQDGRNAGGAIRCVDGRGRMRLGLAPRAVGRMPPKFQFGLALLLARRPAHLPLLMA